jgi:prepilin-type N-terminal cleavage/methylation domain-containing protein
MKLNKCRGNGFTLIELLVVVGIITTLAVVVLVSVKPAQRLSESRDARRAQDLNQLLSAIHSCAVDKKDVAALPTCLGTYTAGNTYEIVDVGVTGGCNAVCTGATSATSCLPLSTTLDDYFVTLPKDRIMLLVAIPDTDYSSKWMTVLEACEQKMAQQSVALIETYFKSLPSIPGDNGSRGHFTFDHKNHEHPTP